MIVPDSGFIPRNTKSSDRASSSSREEAFRKKNGVSTTVMGGKSIRLNYTL
jgi:hypothetical protein